MKKRLLSTLLFLLSTFAFLVAQVPEQMSYQAVLRDAQNQLVTNQRVGMQISILHHSPNGVAVYMERQTATSNAHGLVTVEIGTGHVVAGSMTGIQWGNGNYYIQTEIDLNGGSLYTLTSTVQLLTVPYAFHAKTAGTLTNPPAETDPIFTSWNKDYNDLINRPIIPTLVSSFQNDVPYLITETDPLFTAWGYDYDSLQNAPTIPTNVSAFANDVPYLTSFSETDPLFSVSVAAGITSADTMYWNHLLDSVSLTETDPLFSAWGYDYDSLQNVPTNVSNFVNDAGYLTSADTNFWNHLLDSVSLTETQNLDSVLMLGNRAGNKQIKDLADPTDAQDAVTKKVLDESTQLRVSHAGDTLYLGSSQWVLIPGISATMYYPTVITTIISSILDTAATSGGNVTAQGHDAVIARGVCWSTSPNPTLLNNYTSDSSGLGIFTSNLTGLTANTTYYVRAYATNSIGTAYGNEESFITFDLPTVTTDAISNIASTDATGGGEVTFDGNTSVTARGVCWSTSPNPTLLNNYTSDGSGLGIFTSSITGLTANTTYYVRAYATNSVGTAYGNEVNFTTLPPPIPNCGTVTDIDGNIYNTVIIGSQCWMRENLRVTKFANGTSITLGTSTSSSTKYRYYPNNNSGNVSTHGYLYNWPAAMDGAGSSSSNPSGVQGVCPTGWHLPSDAEWTQLTDYVSSQSAYLCNSDATFIAKALASTSGWNSHAGTCTVGNNPSANNATNFGAVPAGCYFYYNSYSGEDYYEFGDYAYLWSATEDSGTDAYYRYLSYATAVAGGRDDNASKYSGFSVRCLRD